MNALASAILITWKRNAAYALRLAGDIAPGQMLAQPIPGRTLNHPAWIFSHLNLYGDVLTRLCRGQSFEDPSTHRYGPESSPGADPSSYGSKVDLLAEWTRMHDSCDEALRNASDSVLGVQNPLPRWRAVHPTVGDMLVTLMVKHESHHLGQLSTWRRAMGFDRVQI